ncbi:tetratricopeptide repeat protein, partial [Thermodesulfobacteriota bacterium]
AIKSKVKIAEMNKFLDDDNFKFVRKSADVDKELNIKKVYTALYKANKDNPNGEKALYKLAMIAVEQKSEARAMKIFKKLFDEFPYGDHSKDSFGRFIAYLRYNILQFFKDGDMKKVVALGYEYKNEISVASGKDVNEMLFSIGRAMMELKLYSNAKDSFVRLSRESPKYKSEEVYYLCMISSYLSYDYDLSEKCSGELLTNYSGGKHEEEAKYYRAKSLFKLEKYQAAITLTKERIKKMLSKNNKLGLAEAYSGIAEAYSRLNDNNNAVMYYKNILLLEKGGEATAERQEILVRTILKVAELSYLSNNFKDAVTYYEQYFKGRNLKPDDNIHLFYLAKSYKNRKDNDSALLYFNKLITNSSRGFFAKSAKEEIKQIEFIKRYKDKVTNG